ncbi:MAG: tRNA-dihydrouridine synthase, partial [Desulfomonilaceae bacterium]
MTSWLSGTPISAPFTIGSGVVATAPSVLARLAREIPQLGFLTTKTLSLLPKEGYREPIIYEYYPGCFINAVGLANPGAAAFAGEIAPHLPLHNNKPLVVSIMGENPEEFVACAKILDPVASAFELNLSCPHVKGAGQSVGSDPEAVKTIIQLMKKTFSKPVIAKLSPNLGDIGASAQLCERAGVDGLSLINTVGPGFVADDAGSPILSNEVGGISGRGILPIGLKAVRDVARVTHIPIIASGGIAGPYDVRAYQKAGASFFSVGSALAGKDTQQIISFFQYLAQGIGPSNTPHRPQIADQPKGILTAYTKTTVVRNSPAADDLFVLELADTQPCNPGSFFFLRIPAVGEKPFSPMSHNPHRYLIRAVGPFTKRCQALQTGDEIYMRGPYGKGFPEPPASRPLVLIAGGTGAAPLLMAAARWQRQVGRMFIGFSKDIQPNFQRELEKAVPRVRVVVDA